MIYLFSHHHSFFANNSSADIWSVGCTIVEMATGKPPWHEFTDQVSALFHIASSDEIPEIPLRLSQGARTFLLRCFQRDPSKRPSASRLIEFRWLKESEHHKSGSLSSAHSSRSSSLSSAKGRHRSPNVSAHNSESESDHDRRPSQLNESVFSSLGLLNPHVQRSSELSVPTGNSLLASSPRWGMIENNHHHQPYNHYNAKNSYISTRTSSSSTFHDSDDGVNRNGRYHYCVRNDIDQEQDQYQENDQDQDTENENETETDDDNQAKIEFVIDQPKIHQPVYCNY